MSGAAAALPEMEITPQKEGRDSPVLVAAVILALGIAHLGTSTMPFQVGALMDGRGLSGSQAGLFGFCEVGALAAIMVLLAPVIHRVRSLTVGLVGTLIAALANVLLYAMDPPYLVLLALATLAGAGYGLVFAASITGASTARNPDRVYSVGNGGAVIFVVLIMLLMPYGGKHFGPAGAFLAVGVILALSAPTMIAFKARAALPANVPARVVKDPAVASLLILWGAYSLGSGALWSFAERIAKSIHLAPETSAAILSATTLTGVLGTACAAFIAGRVPRIPAMIVGLIGTASSFLFMGFAAGPVSYTIGALAYWVFYMFQYPLFLGAAASLDAEGRVGTLGGGCERLAFAIGAPIAGLIADYGSFPALGIAAFAACVLPMPFCLPIVARRLKGAA